LTKEVSIELAKAIQQALSEIEKKAQKIGWEKQNEEIPAIQARWPSDFKGA
jgi:hypothetical protein